ncbi:acid-sensing ion channel 2-like [Liolophura sinensis]|uniref:acid-sensing ion channel 2-like n=1 Tax=Liolophura sinensis TaxID=3198878 RepID=UPI003158BFA9
MKTDEVKSTKVNSWVDQVEDFSPEKRNQKLSLFQEFSQNATVHGLRHTSQHGLFRRGFWCLAFLGMLSGLLYTVFSQVVVILEYPTITQQSMEFTAGLPFPAVTLCSLNQFRKSVVGDDPAIRQIQLAMSDLGQMSPAINWSDPIWNYTMDQKAVEEMELYLEYIGHPLVETLMFCSWDNKIYECKDIFKVQKTDFGMCFTFNGREQNSTPRYSMHAGSKYGLTVVAKIMQHEYILGSDNDVAGLRVLLHDPEETPLVEGRGFNVAPGKATKGSLKLKQVNYLPPPYKLPFGMVCRNTSAPDFQNMLTLYDRYDIMACFSECRSHYIYKVCGCRAIFDRERFMTENISWTCGCPIPCKMNIYNAEVSMGDYPSSALMEQIQAIFNLTITEAEFRSNYLKLTLAYDEFLIESINQVPEFDFESIMSTFGGQLGIFIGASLLSLLEFIEFGLEIIFFKVLRIGNKTMPRT